MHHTGPAAFVSLHWRGVHLAGFPRNRARSTSWLAQTNHLLPSGCCCWIAAPFQRWKIREQQLPTGQTGTPSMISMLKLCSLNSTTASTQLPNARSQNTSVVPKPAADSLHACRQPENTAGTRNSPPPSPGHQNSQCHAADSAMICHPIPMRTAPR